MLRRGCRRLSVLCRPQDIEHLRPLGGSDDYVKLHLPGNLATSSAHTHACIGALPSWASALPHTAVIEIRNAPARNALSGKMMAELADVVTTLESHGNALSAVVLRGADGHFCAGADIRVAKAHLSSPEGGALMSRVMTSTLTRLRQLPLISVAIVEGAAMGGGAELTTSCDFRLLAHNARLQFVHANMGVSPGWGGAARLVKLVGRQHALRLLARTEKVSPVHALAIGLADEVSTPEVDVEATAHRFLEPICSKHPHVIRGLKRVVGHADDIVLDQMRGEEYAVFQELWGGPANLEALARHRTK
ncbi:hypothetical protein ACHHYP_16095 [Achlya hypogyna]|uniref:Ethylmalonyl-CoA decarboxylase n=1 Tax=Achlya hypogyna TaxID=1202772 RepID=A0A1V9ZER0_ACHHY|nr:hypothetical protein ACHHYP_16095 [Achlya hypogyna]